MSKINCWEKKQCGRETGGEKVDELGVCPVVTESAADDLHGGTNAGRVCWAVIGTLCGGEVQGTFAQKADSCLNCSFYMQVRAEEGLRFLPAAALIRTLHQRSG